MAEARSYRYERKFLLAGVDPAQVHMILRRHRMMFYQPYPPRYVNNMYLDTPEFDNFGDNLAGAMERVKVRVRWYHDLFRLVEDPVLEFKIKSGLVGWKEPYRFPPFHFEPGFSPRTLPKLIQGSDLPPEVKLKLSPYRPSLVNRYRRFYYVTRDGRFRATIDTEMSYYKVNRLVNRFNVHQVDPRAVVVEVKYDQSHEGEVDRIASSFPFRLTRSSKYVQGIEAFYGW
jgi:hypothetical protein